MAMRLALQDFLRSKQGTMRTVSGTGELDKQ